MVSKVLSIPKTTRAMMREATITTTALLVSSELDGQDTFCVSSTYEALNAPPIFLMKLIIVFYLARVERLELPTPGFGDQCSTN